MRGDLDRNRSSFCLNFSESIVDRSGDIGNGISIPRCSSSSDRLVAVTTLRLLPFGVSDDALVDFTNGGFINDLVLVDFINDREELDFIDVIPPRLDDEIYGGGAPQTGDALPSILFFNSSRGTTS
jgi:hypothetical protein